MAEAKPLRKAGQSPKIKARRAKIDEENARIARFISPTRNLVLWKEAIEEEVIGTRTRTKPGSGVAIEFINHRYETNNQETILWLVQHDGFRNDFHPLPVVGDWWEAHEFFKKDQREVLNPTQKAKLRKDEIDKIIAPLSREMAKQINETVEQIAKSTPQTVQTIGS
jgi:hypothetical protein